VHEQIGDFLELALSCDFKNIVSAVMQIIAAAPDRAQRGSAGSDAGRATDFSV
jgi:hypothetical protein